MATLRQTLWPNSRPELPLCRGCKRTSTRLKKPGIRGTGYLGIRAPARSWYGPDPERNGGKRRSRKPSTCFNTPGPWVLSEKRWGLLAGGLMAAPGCPRNGCNRRADLGAPRRGRPRNPGPTSPQGRRSDNLAGRAAEGWQQTWVCDNSSRSPARCGSQAFKCWTRCQASPTGGRYTKAERINCASAATNGEGQTSPPLSAKGFPRTG